MEKFVKHLQDTFSDCSVSADDAPESPVLVVHALAAAARDCATEIGLPVALEDDAVNEFLRATGHYLAVPDRMKAGIAAGLHTFPVGQWSYHAPDLRMFCTAPVDPRPQAAWDDILWLSPRQLLARANEKDAS